MEQKVDDFKCLKILSPQTDFPPTDSCPIFQRKSSSQRKISFRESQKFASANSNKIQIESKFQQVTDYREQDLLFDALNSCSMIITPANFNFEYNQQTKQENIFSRSMRSLYGKKGQQNQVRQAKLIDILKISSNFFEQLPNKVRDFQLGHRDNRNQVKRSNTMLIQNIMKTEQITKVQTNFKSQNQKEVYLELESQFQIDVPLIFYELKDELQELLAQKIYTPYFISHSTILQFQNKKKIVNKYSVLDILELFLNEHINKTKFYFKVNKLDLKKNHKKTQDGGSMNSSSLINKTMQSIDLNKPMSATYDKPGVKISQEIQFIYYEFDIKILSLPDSQFLRKVSFPAEKVDSKDIKRLLFVITEITGILKYQQKIIDQMYLDAIECNYSHEQMTPLNSILANSQIIYRRILATMGFQEQVLEKRGELMELETTKRNNQETMKLLKAIEQSGQIMWFYNQNQIQRIKIQKNEFKKSYKKNTNVESIIEKVINPFEPQINSRNIKVLISWDQDYSSARLKFDLVMYQLILFNIIQNSVKYNQYNGNILVILRVRPIVTERECYDSHQENKECVNINNQQNQKKNQKWLFDSTDFIATHVLETEIIDTGIGINYDRQKMLFEPFLELKIKQDFQDVKDNNIGMGLACSHEITKQLGGDIILQRSSRGLTVFSFKLPIQIENLDPEIKQMSISEQEPNQKKLDQNFQKIDILELQKSMQEYVKEKKLSIIKRIEFKEIQMTSNTKAQSAVQSFIKKQKQQEQQIQRNCGSFSEILMLDSPMVLQASKESSSQQKQISNDIVRSKSLFRKELIDQVQQSAQKDQHQKKKKKEIKVKLKSSANHIVGMYKNIISNEQSSGQSFSGESSFENIGKQANRLLVQQGTPVSDQFQNQPNQLANRFLNSDIKSDHQEILNQIIINKSAQKMNQIIQQNQILELDKNSEQILNRQIQQSIKKIDAQKLRVQRLKDQKLKKEKKKEVQRSVILRPFNPMLANKNIFYNKFNPMDKQKHNLALQLLMGNHKDQLVKIFKSKAKQIDKEDNKDYHFCEYFQVTHKHSECQSLLLKDQVFNIPIFNKQKTKQTSNIRRSNQKKNRIVGLSISFGKNKSIIMNQKRSVQILANQLDSKVFQEEKQNTLKKFKGIRSKSQLSKFSYPKQISDSDSSGSIVKDIVINDINYCKQKGQNNLQNKFNDKLKQIRNEKLGEEGLKWMSQQLNQNGITNIQMTYDDKKDEQILQKQTYDFASDTSEISCDSDFGIIYKKQLPYKQKNSFQLLKDNVTIEEGALIIFDLDDSLNGSQSDQLNNLSGSSGKKKRNKPSRFRAISQKKLRKVEINDEKFGLLKPISEELESLELNELKSKNKANLKFNNFMQIQEEISNSFPKENLENKQVSGLAVKQSKQVQIIASLPSKKSSQLLQKEESFSNSSLEHPNIVSQTSQDECGEDEQSEFEQHKAPSMKSNQLEIQNILSSKASRKCACLPRVLIVDDITFNIIPIQHMASEFTKMIDDSAQLIDTAGNGQIAVDMFRQGMEKDCGCPNRAFKLIFMDLQMPVKGGYQASLEILQIQKEFRKKKRVQEKIVQVMKSYGGGQELEKLERMLLGLESIDIFSEQELAPTLEEEKSECRIVVLTSYTNEATINQCMNAGCSQFLNKPLGYEKLHEVMWKHFFRVTNIEYAQIYLEQFDKPFA